METQHPSLRILYVEDDTDTVRVVRRLLTMEGYSVVTATSVTAALHESDSNDPFDLLITDIGLEDGNGLQLLSDLRSRYPLPGIVLSGYGMPGDIAESAEAGFTKHLIKPVQFSTLKKAIEDCTAHACVRG